MKLTLNSAHYRERHIYEMERRNIWRSEWIMFCTTAELNKPGDYFAGELAGWNILVAVNPDGKLVGFHNLCPHRAGVIAWPGNGTLGNLVCRYHGWAFGWDGKLKSARDFGNDQPLSAEQSTLTGIRVDTWGPFVFVCLDPESENLSKMLGGIVDQISNFQLDDFSYAHRTQRELACNWKTYVDNYLEGYHVSMLHPTLSRALDMSTYKVTIPEDSYCIHTCDTTSGSAAGGAWLFRYPNLAINIYADGMNVERIIPLSHEKTTIVYDYFAVDTSPENIARMVEMSNVVLDEDQNICELVQRNLDSGLYETGVLSPRHETGLDWFQTKVRAGLKE